MKLFNIAFATILIILQTSTSLAIEPSWNQKTVNSYSYHFLQNKIIKSNDPVNTITLQNNDGPSPLTTNCPYGCSKCFLHDPNICVSCSGNYVLLDNSCCTANCNECRNGDCYHCEGEFVLQDGKCMNNNYQQCNPREGEVYLNENCQQCNEEFGAGCRYCAEYGCSQCVEGWNLNENSWCVYNGYQQCSTKGCSYCQQAICYACEEEYEFSKGQCKYLGQGQPPIKNCAYYTSVENCDECYLEGEPSGVCSLCIQGYTLEDNDNFPQCVKNDWECVQGCSNCYKNICNNCQSGYLYSKGECTKIKRKACVYGCEFCEEGLCNGCYNHLKLWGTSRYCTSAESGCSEGCYNCYKNQCQSCVSGYNLQSGQCIIDKEQKCKNGCGFCDEGVCGACLFGYIMDVKSRQCDKIINESHKVTAHTHFLQQENNL